MSDSDSDDENFILYGTPLDPFEEDEVPSKRKFQQPADQYAVDDHGRRRFHGAFTGGFSAGFGNTVGTPEGWTPSSFRSSRLEKAQASKQKPEDFMDEEDRSEFGIAPRHMQTNHEFSGRKRPRAPRFHDGPIPGEPVLEQLVRAVHETAAVKMLRRMGWKEGQGVGDRVTHREKKKSKEQHKVYGCYMPPEMRQEPTQSSDSSDSEFEYETLFAPDDYEPYILQKKSDRFGLGYKGLSRHSVLGNLGGDERSHLVMKEKGKKVSIRGQAFGVGAFEADDEDIYATQDMSHYDFALGNPAEAKTSKKNVKAINVIEGFVKATQPMPSVPAYAPPALPRDYTPLAAGTRRSRFEPTAAVLHRDQGLGRHELTAEARGALLGEVPVPKTPIDTHDPPQTTSQTPRQTEMSKFLQKNINFISPNTETVQAKSTPDFISIKDSGKEQVAPIFKPFAGDPLKQSRYEMYLRDKDSVMLERERDADRLSEWERNREMVEFEQAAILYRPLSGAMGDRFTHASEPDDALNPLCAVAKSSINYGLATPEQVEAAKIGAYGLITRKESAWRPEALVCKRFNVPELGGARVEPKKDGKPNVSYSIFSYLESSVHDKESFTKEQSKFGGSKSLNFENKKDTSLPSKEKHNEVINIEKDKVSDISIDKPTTSQVIVSNTNSSQEGNKRMTVVDLFLKESEKDLQTKQQGAEVTETIEKFDKIDLYKAIFLSDSENEDINDDDTTAKDKDDNDFIVKPKNIERNTSPPRGIFANIDFDEINAWRRPENESGDNKTVENNIQTKPEETKEKTIDSINDGGKEMTGEVEQEETYGPKIPENLKKRLESAAIIEIDNFKPIFTKKNKSDDDNSLSSSDSWVEIKTKSKKDKKKKSKKHKSKHKKSKSKHKKKF
ncbi:G patch domain-containing protein 1 homolog isoform X2 [Bicyclus anynana]|uniref:G patch domain-containing protein 1 homolog isoform X2 n=1 Tax=Bicyclus anynana TaxID=110368 RepID=A0A6J1NXH7_BICAN|nr:G patch domain-containing protein 1 homolog isoform X2 [Bicyclus anynana]